MVKVLYDNKTQDIIITDFGVIVVRGITFETTCFKD